MNVYYMNGAGNDFMVIDARGLSLDFSRLAAELCKKMDCDGFMAVDHSAVADFKLHFYNADGSRGEMCGNGSRCICRFAYDLGIAGAEMTVETDAGLVPGWRLDENRYRVKLNNPSILDLNRNSLRMDKAIVQRVVKLGVPAGLTQMIFALSNILVQSLTNTLGDAMVAANTAIMRVDGFAMMPNFTFGIAATTFAGQNVGARRWDRVKQGAKATLILAVGTATVLVIGILLFGKNLMQVFTATPEIVDLGVSMMRLLAVGYIAFAVTQTLQGIMRGCGETVVPMWISIIVTVIIRMPLAYLWAHLNKSPAWPNGDPTCLYGSLLIAWCSGCVLSILFYIKGKWRKRTKKALTEPTEDTEPGNTAQPA